MVFSIINIVVCVIFAIYGIQKDKVIPNPLTLFCSIWGLIVFLSSLQLYGLFETDDIFYFYILIGCICFIISYLFVQNCNFRFRIKKKNSFNYIINYKMLYLLNVLCILYYLYQIYLLKKQISILNMFVIQQYLRNDLSTLITNKYLRLLNSFIIGPISYAMPSVVAADIWIGKRDKKLVLLTTILLIIKAFSTGNRSALMILFFLLITDALIKQKFQKFSLYSKWKTSSRKLKRKISVISIIGILAFISMSISRNLQIAKNMYLYFAIEPYMFQVWGNIVESEHLIGFGMTSLSGFIFPIAYFFQMLFGFSTMPTNYQNIYNLIDSTVTLWKMVGTNIPANAYVSLFWYFFVDGRIIGIIIGSLIFGIVCSHYFKILAKYFNVKNLCIYNMILLAVFYSYVRMQFALPNFVLSLLFIRVIPFKKINNIHA